MRLAELLSYNEIIVQCHNYPDADTIASGYGVYCYLKDKGKKVRLVYGGDLKITKPNLLIMLEQLSIPLEYVTELHNPELLVTVDCTYGEKNIAPFTAKNYASIDHHRQKADIPALSEIRSNYGSCSTVVYMLLKAENYDIDRNIKLSTALYYGLYSDTGNLSEIRHPADRDLRDFARIDNSVLALLTNSVLSLNELKIAGNALNKACYNTEKRYALSIAEPCDPNILGYINDLILQVDSVDTSVVGCFVSRGFKISVRSCISDIHADEMASFITDGNGGGYKQKAGGLISDIRVGEDVEKLLRERIDAYYNSYDVAKAESYKPDISEMKLCRKLPERVGFAKTTDIVPSGTEIKVRMIEGDLDIIADDDVYIMIGRKGNIYPISREKFEATYIPADDDFSLKAEYEPNIITRDSSIYSIMPFARSCVSSESGASIYTKKLDRTLKLYTRWDHGNYMLGRVGDYLAVRSDDTEDMYIITEEQFGLIYRES